MSLPRITELLESVSSGGDGTLIVAAAITPVVLKSSTACRWVNILPTSTNTGGVSWGFTTAAPNPIYSGGTYIEVANTNLIYIKVAVNGEGVSFSYGV